MFLTYALRRVHCFYHVCPPPNLLPDPPTLFHPHPTLCTHSCVISCSVQILLPMLHWVSVHSMKSMKPTQGSFLKEKKNLPFNQLSVSNSSSDSGGTPCLLALSLKAGILSGLRLCRFCTSFHNLWVHVCIFTVVSRKHYFLAVQPQPLIVFLLILYQWFLSFKERRWNIDVSFRILSHCLLFSMC